MPASRVSSLPHPSPVAPGPMAFIYQFAASAIMLLHFAYVAYVVLGQVAILAGLALGRQWARSPLLRMTHLVAIMIVVVEAVLNITCPLTVWEQQLRRAAGQNVAPNDFIAVWIHRVMFFDFEPWVFTAAYVVFGLVVLITFVAAPPRFRRRTT